LSSVTAAGNVAVRERERFSPIIEHQLMPTPHPPDHVDQVYVLDGLGFLITSSDLISVLSQAEKIMPEDTRTTELFAWAVELDPVSIDELVGQ
jgi:hypothetical protein